MRRKRPRSALEDDSDAIAYADALLKGLARTLAHSHGCDYDSPAPNSIRGWPVWPETPPDLAEESAENERIKSEQWWMRGMQSAIEAINYKVRGGMEPSRGEGG